MYVYYVRVEQHVCLLCQSGVTCMSTMSEWSNMYVYYVRVEQHVCLLCQSGATCMPIMSEWSDMSTIRLLFQLASTVKIQVYVKVKYKPGITFLSSFLERYFHHFIKK
jgi:hypothetical protein